MSLEWLLYRLAVPVTSKCIVDCPTSGTISGDKVNLTIPPTPTNTSSIYLNNTISGTSMAGSWTMDVNSASYNLILR